MEQVKLSAILENVKEDNQSWFKLINYLKKFYDGNINLDELVMLMFPTPNNKALLFVKLDNGKYLIIDAMTAKVYPSPKVNEIFDYKLFNIVFHDPISKEDFHDKFTAIQVPQEAAYVILRNFQRDKGLSYPSSFTLPVDENLKITINMASGLVSFITPSHIETSNFDLTPINSSSNIIGDYDIKARFLPLYIQNRKEEFNPGFEKKYGYPKS